ncbi:MAG TPA: Ppx/GppA phosphatase family protein [Acidimicrobiales bacterium]|nr:Ppx/GppA phosphatase family protein [Acidimicrobiales bacterium]
MTVLAAVDCGTSATRLLVTDGDRRLERLMRFTRLGEGVDAEGHLAPAAVERTLTVLREYRDLMDRHGVERMRAVTTSAARDGANRALFFDAAAEVLGAPMELLSGDDEARLSFAGAVSELDPADGPFLVVDIGGGSTEFAVGSIEAEGVLSVDIGSVRLTEKFLHHDPPTAEELSQAISVIHLYLEDVQREIPQVMDVARMVGLAGTVTTVAAVELGLAAYDRDRIHHFALSRDAAEDVFRTLATEPLADRVHNPGLERERADIIVGGVAILVATMRHLGFETCLVSEADILDGLIASIADR